METLQNKENHKKHKQMMEKPKTIWEMPRLSPRKLLFLILRLHRMRTHSFSLAWMACIFLNKRREFSLIVVLLRQVDEKRNGDVKMCAHVFQNDYDSYSESPLLVDVDEKLWCSKHMCLPGSNQTRVFKWHSLSDFDFLAASKIFTVPIMFVS